jgi:hypothetical protein
MIVDPITGQTVRLKLRELGLHITRRVESGENDESQSCLADPFQHAFTQPAG